MAGTESELRQVYAQSPGAAAEHSKCANICATAATRTRALAQIKDKMTTEEAQGSAEQKGLKKQRSRIAGCANMFPRRQAAPWVAFTILPKNQKCECERSLLLDVMSGSTAENGRFKQLHNLSLRSWAPHGEDRHLNSCHTLLCIIWSICYKYSCILLCCAFIMFNISEKNLKLTLYLHLEVKKLKITFNLDTNNNTLQHHIW